MPIGRKDSSTNGGFSASGAEGLPVASAEREVAKLETRAISENVSAWTSRERISRNLAATGLELALRSYDRDLAFMDMPWIVPGCVTWVGSHR
jgi:hypothetical protein